MNLKTIRQLHHEGLLSDESLFKSEAAEKNSLFSLHWELKTLLYLGVFLVSSGLGVIVYKNINTIGHQAVLVFIVLVCVGSFFYCRYKAPSFSTNKVAPPDPFFDYLVLLGCLTFITFIAYLQYAYSLFGDRYGIPTFTTLIILFLSAYRFDHLGVLSLAITNLAAWIGITVTPIRLFLTGQVDEMKLVYSGLLLGIVLHIAAWLSEKKNIKKHFSFTYQHFGIQILFISCLAGLFMSLRVKFIWLILSIGIGYYIYRQAMKIQSFYFILLVALYTYIALSYFIIFNLTTINFSGNSGLYFIVTYFIVSAVCAVRLLMAVNQKMKLK